MPFGTERYLNFLLFLVKTTSLEQQQMPNYVLFGVLKLVLISNASRICDSFFMIYEFDSGAYFENLYYQQPCAEIIILRKYITFFHCVCWFISADGKISIAEMKVFLTNVSR